MKMRVADYIADFLEKKGVKKVFLLSGGGMMHLLDAVSRKEKISYIANHHEQASAMAAEAYARVSGGVGVCYATSGPGATNILTGIVGAWQDSSPVIFITGQSKHTQTIQHSKLTGLRQFGTFEVDIVPIVQSVTKYAVFIDDPEQVKFHLEKAYALSVDGRPGPVLIDVPVNIQGALIDPDTLRGYEPDSHAFNISINEAQIDTLLHSLKDAKRPLLLAGHGIRASGSVLLFDHVISKLNLPIVTTSLAKDLISYDHPLFVGHVGVKGDRAGNFAVQTADLILVIGSSLHVTTTGYELELFAPQAYKIQVEPDVNVLQREQVNINEKIQIDIKVFLEKIFAKLKNEYNTLIETNLWHDKNQQWKEEFAVINEPHKRTTKINYYDFVHELSNACQGNEIITTDAGSAYYVVGQAFRQKKNQRVIVSGALGAMGFALPAATGAAAYDTSTNVICITGDGSLHTNIHELATIRSNNLNIKMFILNNGGYISIKNTQINYFSGHFAGVDEKSGVFLPQLQIIAAAYNLPYVLISSPTSLGRDIKKVLAMKGPAFCEVTADPDQEIIPTVSSQRLANGSMLSKPLHDMAPFIDAEVIKKHMDLNEE